MCLLRDVVRFLSVVYCWSVLSGQRSTFDFMFVVNLGHLCVSKSTCPRPRCALCYAVLMALIFHFIKSVVTRRQKICSVDSMIWLDLFCFVLDTK